MQNMYYNALYVSGLSLCHNNLINVHHSSYPPNGRNPFTVLLSFAHANVPSPKIVQMRHITWDSALSWRRMGIRTGMRCYWSKYTGPNAVTRGIKWFQHVISKSLPLFCFIFMPNIIVQCIVLWIVGSILATPCRRISTIPWPLFYSNKRKTWQWIQLGSCCGRMKTEIFSMKATRCEGVRCEYTLNYLVFTSLSRDNGCKFLYAFTRIQYQSYNTTDWSCIIKISPFICVSF